MRATSRSHWRPSRSLVLCAVTALGGLGCASESRSELPVRVALRPCDVPGITGDALCGTHEVYENRAAKSGRKIGLNVVVLPALAGASADPVFWLEGGPGGAATRSIGPVSTQYLSGLRDDRDLVFVDQRGTGESHPLRCDDIGDTPANIDRYYGRLFPVDLIRACRQKLEQIADLTQYTTPIAMDDLDDVRSALGYEKINLAGASYGTLAAQVYMRQHPDRVRAAFLVGVATPGLRLPLPFARAAQNALDRLFADCAADGDCRSAFPNLKTEFDAVLARFDGGPIRVTMVDPSTKTERQVTLERESYVERLRRMLYTTGMARFVPLVVHQAFLNDYLPLQALSSRLLAGVSMARGMYFSVTCSESATSFSEQEIAAETAGTFLGDRRIRAHMAACAEWPKGTLPDRYYEPVSSPIPTVMFSGDVDGSTPPWVAEAAVKSLSRGRQITAVNTGHQIDGPCTWDLMQAFIREPSVQALDTACTLKPRRPPFATELPR